MLFSMLSKLRLLFFSLLLMMIMSFIEASASEISVDYIRGEGDVEGIKLAYRVEPPFIPSFSEKIDVYFESSINFWRYGNPEKYDSNFVISISPVFRYNLLSDVKRDVFIEAGIGIALLDDTDFAGKNVSTHYQFEDRVGIGYKFGEQKKYSIALRYFHYSNAGFKKPNPGLDFISFSFSLAY